MYSSEESKGALFFVHGLGYVGAITGWKKDLLFDEVKRDKQR